MAERGGGADSRFVDLAINQVLAAECDARTLVEACRAEAERILDQAEVRARRIARRTERRVQAAHRIADATVGRTLRHLGEDSARGMLGHAAETDEERLGRAVARLVREIVGASP